MTRNVAPLNQHLNVLPVFFDHMEQLWNERQGPEGVRDALEKKRALMESDKIRGIVLFEENAPVGIAWVERVSLHYGNTVMDVLKEGAEPELVYHLVKSGYLDDVLVELIHFAEKAPFRELLLQQGFVVNERQRMALDLTRELPFEEDILPPHLNISPLDLSDARLSSEISYKAHKVSQDQPNSPDMATPAKRYELEKRVLASEFGRIIPEATLKIRENGVIVGGCIVVDIACWGLDHVPWIFDIYLDPAHHGKGYGKILLQKSMLALVGQHYEFAGLAVTLSNTSAIPLYEKSGFFLVDHFTEFSRPIDGASVAPSSGKAA